MEREQYAEGRKWAKKIVFREENSHKDEHLFLLTDECDSKAVDKLNS